MKLMDHIYLSLTDHLSFAARRIRDGIVLQNFYTLEMRKFNPNEFQVGEYAVRLMSGQLGMEVPMDEAEISPSISSTPSTTTPTTARTCSSPAR